MRTLLVLAPVTAVAALLAPWATAVVILGMVSLGLVLALMAVAYRHASGTIRSNPAGLVPIVVSVASALAAMQAMADLP